MVGEVGAKSIDKALDKISVEFGRCRCESRWFEWRTVLSGGNTGLLE